MKKYIYILTTIWVFGSLSCQDSLEELFPDPNQYEPTTEVIPKLAAKVLQNSRDMNNWGMSFYQTMSANGYGWPVRTHITNDWHSHTGYEDYDNFEQSCPVKGLNAYYDFNKSRFRGIPEMELRISNLPSERSEGMMVYSHTLRILWLEAVLKSVNTYNSVPYFEALKGVEGIFYPKFDDPWEIYQDVMERLKVEADGLAAAYSKLTPEDKAAFEHHDVYFEGDANKWVALAEAFRLRAAIRVSGVKQSEASTIINEVVSRGKLPTDDLETTVGDWISTLGKGMARKGNGGKFTYRCFTGPDHLSWMDINRNKVYDEGVDDPRLPVLVMPNKEGLYQPVSYDYNAALAITDSSLTYNKAKYKYNGMFRGQKSWYNKIDQHLKYDPFAHWHGITLFSLIEPECYFTKAEVELLLCEAVEKGLTSNTGKSARQHLEQAIKYSTEYWYHIYTDYGLKSPSINTIPEELNGIKFRDIMLPMVPSGSVVDNYAGNVGQNFADAPGIEDKMEIIMQQKFITLNMHNVTECFADFRRTRHPVLSSFRLQDGSIRETKMVERQRYLTDPANYNTENFAAVIDQDNFTTPIFWVPENLRSVQPYKINDWAFYVEYPGIEETFKN